MAPIAGRPFLEILLSSLAQKGFDRVILSLGFMAEKISKHFGTEFAGMQISYVIEDQPLGTGGAIRLAMEQVIADHVFVLNGDTFIDLEVEKIEEQWALNHRALIISREVQDAARYGRLLLADGKLTGFSEKGRAGPGLINAGCYIFSQDHLKNFVVGKSFSIETDYLVSAAASGLFDVFVTRGQFIDIGVPEDFLRAQTELQGR